VLTMPPEPGAAKPRIGPRMREIANFASTVPGRSLSDALGAAGISSRGRSSARAPVYRAEAAGLIIFDHVRSNLTRVFANLADRAQYYADREEEELSEVRTLSDVVSALPGCSKAGALRAAGVPVHGLNKAIAAGLILVDYERANRCHLFATETDRRRWYLRRELLQPGAAAERVAEIRAEVSALEAERAATWTDGPRRGLAAG
jgi:hypothetical protein